ncbi:MAG: opacity-associated protein OapA [[Pasteurella] mairii]|uniref:Opacity-associated protein OapA n=1 Tax=[Pasteurella] mairii TaxID=757 RepID=A0A379B2B6_9PAST|nr:opacity-associated protein OapA [[Pasteurella] mairii]SUB32737.1 opacity-associated protein OapA [[Pasteurella] mairii]
MTTENNKPEIGNQNNPQKELDLEFDQMEPITPKKPHTPEPSLLNKAKGFIGNFSRKGNPSEAPFHVRKEPTFGSVNVAQQNEPTINHDMVSKNDAVTEKVAPIHADNTATPISTQENITLEKPETSEAPVAQTQTQAPTNNIKNPENWAVLQVLPPKYRRIFIVLLLAILLLLIWQWLKPSSDTVNAFEQANSQNIPTQFQPLNQSQPVENNVLDNINNSATSIENTNSTESVTATDPVLTPAPTNNTATETRAPIATQSEQLTAVAPGKSALAEEKPKAVEPVKPIEAPKVVEKPKTTTVENPKTIEKAKTTVAEKPKAQITQAKPVVKSQSVPVVEAKPTGKATAERVKSATVGSKTLTIPQGVSLMQVFRDNQLNISDVNAMTKANGAGNSLSSFKPGDKVQVSLNSQGRVNELRLSNGARFIRQADGSYQYKK